MNSLVHYAADEPGVRITWAAELWQWRPEPGEQFGGSAHAPATREMAWKQAGS